MYSAGGNSFKNRRRKKEERISYYYPYEGYPPYENPTYLPQVQHNYQQMQQNPAYYQQGQLPPYMNGYQAQGFPVQQPQTMIQQAMYANPYPKPVPNAKNQAGGISTVMSQFKKPDGQMDFNKVMDTAGQMMGAVNQMSSLVKGVTSMFKV
ncbi:YppG family protein [Metabacillus idriensis]|uniref:YppG family protein n=1 Tax=Metabacillus idriensis TaxID=324768 RepID=UPI00281461B4|nr:YppG family protein [Metabacillus idriensis]MDR0139750.1 YppG family protein [Metabacillus idriensis]